MTRADAKFAHRSPWPGNFGQIEFWAAARLQLIWKIFLSFYALSVISYHLWEYFPQFKPSPSYGLTSSYVAHFIFILLSLFLNQSHLLTSHQIKNRIEIWKCASNFQLIKVIVHCHINSWFVVKWKIWKLRFYILPILERKHPFPYLWSSDFTQRRQIKSYNPRLLSHKSNLLKLQTLYKSNNFWCESSVSSYQLLEKI